MMRCVGALPEERHAVRHGLYSVLFLQKQKLISPVWMHQGDMAAFDRQSDQEAFLKAWSTPA
jgi:hypothetical protein